MASMSQPRPVRCLNPSYMIRYSRFLTSAQYFVGVFDYPRALLHFHTSVRFSVFPITILVNIRIIVTFIWLIPCLLS